jgi:hypothetical protein
MSENVRATLDNSLRTDAERKKESPLWCAWIALLVVTIWAIALLASW